MRKIDKSISGIILFFAILLYSTAIQASTFSWDTEGWTDGDLSNSYTNVDNSGIDISVTVTGDTASLNDKDNTPMLDDDEENLANNNLEFYPDYDDGTQSITVTIKFSVPVQLSNLRWRDIDYSAGNGSFFNPTDGFDDKIIVSAKDKNGNTVYDSSRTQGSAIESLSQGEYESDDSQNYTPEDAKAMVTLGFDTYVTELTFVYTNGDSISSNNDPDPQAIWFDDFNFQAKDTDGDGVADFRDIDDDNDGILDAVEIQGAGNCPYGFFHMIGGVLNVFDEENKVYLPIGAQHVSINAMGFDDQSGKLYAALREDTTDDYGNSLLRNDIIEIDRYSGKIKKASASNKQLNSFAADFYDGALYARTSTSSIDKWTKSADALASISTGNYNAADFAISHANGSTMAYGLYTTDTTSGNADNTQLFQINLDDGTVATPTLTVTTPDGLDLHNGWGATFFTDDNNSNRKLYAANNNGYIYEIVDFDTSSPSVTFTYRSVATNNNDGASCRDANQYAVDSDGDGIPDYLDLDSDNDGIPDNVEAQPTAGYDAPLGTWTDVDGDGLADQYDDDTSGVVGSNGLIPINTDGDNSADFLDPDSDNDGYTDCEEGRLSTLSGKNCPIASSPVNDNGVVNWADTGSGSAGSYTDPNLGVNTPTDDLEDYDDGNQAEVDYRKILCGKALTTLTHFQWKMISVPCDTGSNTIDTLFGTTLGTYDTEWQIFKQTGDDDYEVSDTHRNTNKTKLTASSTLEVGKGYWIIIDAGGTGNEKNISIDPSSISGLAPTSTEDANKSTISIDNSNFTKVHEYELPKGGDANNVKYMTGNPFPFAFQMSDVYFKHNANGQSYNAMGATVNDTYIESTVYIHDSNKTGPVDGYVAVDPATPGFNGSIPTMTGFFVKIKSDSNDNDVNHFAYPLMNK